MASGIEMSVLFCFFLSFDFEIYFLKHKRFQKIYQDILLQIAKPCKLRKSDMFTVVFSVNCAKGNQP